MMIKEYLKYAMDKKTSLEIESIKGNKFDVDILQYNSEKVFYKYLSNGKKGKIKFKNIKNCKFKDKESEKQFYYSKINKQYNQTDIKSVIENFEKYYRFLKIYIPKRITFCFRILQEKQMLITSQMNVIPSVTRLYYFSSLIYHRRNQ